MTKEQLECNTSINNSIEKNIKSEETFRDLLAKIDCEKFLDTLKNIGIYDSNFEIVKKSLECDDVESAIKVLESLNIRDREWLRSPPIDKNYLNKFDVKEIFDAGMGVYFYTLICKLWSGSNDFFTCCYDFVDRLFNELGEKDTLEILANRIQKFYPTAGKFVEVKYLLNLEDISAFYEIASKNTSNSWTSIDNDKMVIASIFINQNTTIDFTKDVENFIEYRADANESKLFTLLENYTLYSHPSDELKKEVKKILWASESIFKKLALTCFDKSELLKKFFYVYFLDNLKEFEIYNGKIGISNDQEINNQFFEVYNIDQEKLNKFTNKLNIPALIDKDKILNILKNANFKQNTIDDIDRALQCMTIKDFKFKLVFIMKISNEDINIEPLFDAVNDYVNDGSFGLYYLILITLFDKKYINELLHQRKLVNDKLLSMLSVEDSKELSPKLVNIETKTEEVNPEVLKNPTKNDKNINNNQLELKLEETFKDLLAKIDRRKFLATFKKVGIYESNFKIVEKSLECDDVESALKVLRGVNSSSDKEIFRSPPKHRNYLTKFDLEEIFDADLGLFFYKLICLLWNGSDSFFKYCYDYVDRLFSELEEEEVLEIIKKNIREFDPRAGKFKEIKYLLNLEDISSFYEFASINTTLSWHDVDLNKMIIASIFINQNTTIDFTQDVEDYIEYRVDANESDLLTLLENYTLYTRPSVELRKKLNEVLWGANDIFKILALTCFDKSELLQKFFAVYFYEHIDEFEICNGEIGFVKDQEINKEFFEVYNIDQEKLNDFVNKLNILVQIDKEKTLNILRNANFNSSTIQLVDKLLNSLTIKEFKDKLGFLTSITDEDINVALLIDAVEDYVADESFGLYYLILINLLNYKYINEWLCMKKLVNDKLLSMLSEEDSADLLSNLANFEANVEEINPDALKYLT